MIDDFPVTCWYRSPEEVAAKVKPLTSVWIENHCLISKYCLQMTKCDDVLCCKPFRSNIRELLGQKFIPGPLLIKRDPMQGINLAQKGDTPGA